MRRIKEDGKRKLEVVMSEYEKLAKNYQELVTHMRQALFTIRGVDVPNVDLKQVMDCLSIIEAHADLEAI
jgi:hypothetical protein